MKLTVFKKIGLPKNKDEKKSFSRYSSKPYEGEAIFCLGVKELLLNITSHGWSPSLFKGFRNQSSFIETNFLVLDIDEDLRIEEALKIVKDNDMFCVCLPTTSHTLELHKFRLIFPTCETITGRDAFVSNMEMLRELFPQADKQCVTDNARFYFPCIMSDEGFIYEGQLIVPILKEVVINDVINTTVKIAVESELKDIVKFIYGEHKQEIPEAVDYFIKNANTGLIGEWNTEVNKFVFTLALQGVDFDTVYNAMTELAPEDLDSSDEYLIERAYRQGSESRDIQ